MRATAMVVASVLLLAACASSDSTTGIPATTSSCTGGSSIQLAPLQGVVVNCSSGTSVTLPGGGARYLIVPNLAVADVPNRATTYTIQAAGGVNAAVVAGAPMLSLTSSGPGLAQQRFERLVRAYTSVHLRTQRVSAPAAARQFAVAAPVPGLGSLRGFRVISTMDTITTTFKAVTARLNYVGTNVLIYQDTLSPAGGFTSADLASFGALFDQVLYPIDLNNFGPPSDVDQNGHLIMLLTPVVNGLTPASSCSTQGFVAGFVTGSDLVSPDSNSAHGEVFYSLAPDPNGVFSCAHSAAEVAGSLGPTFLHEVQHLINFSQHVLVHGGQPEDGWLDEGLSLVAEELGAEYYENKYPAPSGRTDPSQLFPDSAEDYISTLLATSYDYLTDTDSVSLTLHSDDQTGLMWRAGDWLLLHWLGDQKGPSTYYRALEETSLTGTANLAAAAAEPFPQLFGDFSTALFTDSLPGVPRASIPAQDRFTTRNLRRLYARLFTVGGPPAGFSSPFPILPRTLTGTLSGSLLPGAMSFYQLNTGSGATATVTFSAPGGAPLPANLQPQLSIFRLQ